jgi:uncharacterized membrane protein YdjX (TVP38/TMEM64 family)
MPARRRVAPALLWLSVSLLAALLLLLGRSPPLEPALAALSVWLAKLGGWGPLVFGLFAVAATVLFVPVIPLALAAGALFGLWTGVATVSLAATTSAALTFLIARRCTRSTAQHWLQKRPRLIALEEAIVEGGWKLIALLRLSSTIPFSLLNYAYGLTRIGFWSYITVSWLAMLPGACLYVYMGDLTGSALKEGQQRSPAEWASLGVGLLAMITASIYLTSRANQKLRERTTIKPQALERRIRRRCLLTLV